MSQKDFLGIVGFAGALIIALIGVFIFVEKVPETILKKATIT